MDWRRKGVATSLNSCFFYRPNKEESKVNECGFLVPFEYICIPYIHTCTITCVSLFSKSVLPPPLLVTGFTIVLYYQLYDTMQASLVWPTKPIYSYPSPTPTSLESIFHRQDSIVGMPPFISQGDNSIYPSHKKLLDSCVVCRCRHDSQVQCCPLLDPLLLYTQYAFL